MESKFNKNLNKIVNQTNPTLKQLYNKPQSKQMSQTVNQNQQKGSRYKKIKRLGQGSYGSCNIALKKIKFSAYDQGIPITTLRQITALKNLNHQNIIKINDVHYHWNQKKMYLNLQFMNENLQDHIKAHNPLQPNVIKVYLFQIVNAVQYMNLNLFLHRDLKPLNILVNDKGKIKLCDFGQSKMFSINQPIKITDNIGTLWYKAPQMMLGAEQFGPAIDVWSIGTIFAEMALGQPLFKGDSQIGQIFKILRICGTPSLNSPNFKNCKHLSHAFPKFKKVKLEIPNIGEQGNDLLQKMLELDPSKRIPIGKILRHDYFEGL